MKITFQELDHLANLAKIKLTDKEKKIYPGQLSAILDFVEKLNEARPASLRESAQINIFGGRSVAGAANLKSNKKNSVLPKTVLREDKAVSETEETKEEIIKQFSDRNGKLLKAKPVFNWK